MALNVALSVDSLAPQLTGIGRYCWELATRLPRASEIARVTFVRNRVRINDIDALRRAPDRLTRVRRFAQLQLSRIMPAPAADVVHGPNYFLPAWADDGVVTVHDLSVFRYPETHPPERIHDFEKRFASTIAKAAHLITDSDTVRRELIEYTGFPVDRVTSVPLGISEEFRPRRNAELEPVLRAYGLSAGGYGLTVSTLEPRKRIDRLIQAWRLLPREIRTRFPLVIAGARGWRNDHLQAMIENAHAEGWLLPLGFVPEDNLAALYAGAALFVYPSQYEGFGLPPLEAMASGIPTVVADVSCLTEVTKGAALLVDPDDLERFAEALLSGLLDQNWRERAVSAGIQVARSYSWDRCVRETVAVYQRVTDG